MSNYNMNSGYGLAESIRLHTGLLVLGKILIVCPSTDSNYDKLADLVQLDPEGEVRLFTTLQAAYTAAKTNRNDVILLQGTGAHSLEAGILWEKSRIHVFGCDGGDRLIQQGARINTTGNPSTAYLIKVTGTRNTFRNVKFEQNSTNGSALTCVQMGGEGTLYKNCSFVFGTDVNLDGSETTTYEVVCGEDSGTFINCTFGQDTLVTTGARTVMAIDRVNGSQPFKNNIFKDCIWKISSTVTGASLVKILANTDLVFGNEFINPIFNNAIVSSLSAVAIADAFVGASGLVAGSVMLINPACNCLELCTVNTDQIKVIGYGMQDGATGDPHATIGVALTPA